MRFERAHMAHSLAEDPLLRATITGDFIAWGAGDHTGP
jgi:hypothetical protein